MISFMQPRVLSWDGMEVPIDFPYLTAILQGPPTHEHDGFSLQHPRMDRGKRAKIFAPFDALDGYSDAVRSKDVEYVERIDLHEDGLAEEERRELSRRMEILHDLTLTGERVRKNQVVVTVTYFVPCEDENSFAFGTMGRYEHATGICRKVDFVNQTMTVDGAVLHLDDIICVDSADGVFDVAWELE